jgi:hypothetical protein
LVDPCLENADLVGRQRFGGRHPRSTGRVDEAMIELAAVRIARSDDRLCSTSQRVRTSIQPEPVHLLIRSVAAVTIVAKNRLDFALVVDGVRRLAVQTRCAESRKRGDKQANTESDHRLLQGSGDDGDRL